MENALVQAELLKPGGIAARLVAARTRANLQGNELAKRAGWHPSKVSKLENGQQMPTADDVHTWLRTCGVDGRVIREMQADLDDIRHLYPDLQRAGRVGRRTARQLTVIPVPAEALASAFADGYAAAIRDMRASLSVMVPPTPARSTEEELVKSTKVLFPTEQQLFISEVPQTGQ